MQALSESLPTVLAPKTIDNDLGLNYAAEPDEWVRHGPAAPGDAAPGRPGRGREGRVSGTAAATRGTRGSTWRTW